MIKLSLVLGMGFAFAASVARADTLQVGAGKTYATPCDAVAAAQPNDEITIAPGTYTDSCAIGVAGLTLRGEGGRPKIDLSGTDHPAQYKGIYVVTAADVTIENLELTGAHISDANGTNAAGIRVEAPGLTVRGCYIHDNQNGILGGTTGALTIEHTELFHNALGDGCNQGGCTHNVYVANIDTLYFRFNWSHGLATDTADKGHLLKSRAKNNYILYNRLSGEDGFDSYEVNLPNGGLAVLVGNQIQKGPNAGNGILLSWGEEGTSNPDARVFLVANTFVNDHGSGTFLSVSGATLVAHDNVFAGSGSVGAGGTLSADNWVGADPMFVDGAQFDYRPQSGSPLIGLAVDPGAADQFSLTPTSEYAHPAGERVRVNAHDTGALEHDTPLGDGGAGASSGDAAVPGTTQDAGHGVGLADAGGVGTPRDAAANGASDGDAAADGGEQAAASTNDGCTCSAPGGKHGLTTSERAAACSLLAMCVLALRRTRRASRAREDVR